MQICCAWGTYAAATSLLLDTDDRCVCRLIAVNRLSSWIGFRQLFRWRLRGQPILGAMDSTAAHSDGYSPRCSCTMRTARSRTSGENLFVLFMAPFSQELEPPQIPGRFSEVFSPWNSATIKKMVGSNEAPASNTFPNCFRSCRVVAAL